MKSRIIFSFSLFYFLGSGVSACFVWYVSQYGASGWEALWDDGWYYLFSLLYLFVFKFKRWGFIVDLHLVYWEGFFFGKKGYYLFIEGGNPSSEVYSYWSPFEWYAIWAIRVRAWDYQSPFFLIVPGSRFGEYCLQGEE